jgi:RimJ/RimL family protein N-acetyltransferase
VRSDADLAQLRIALHRSIDEQGRAVGFAGVCLIVSRDGLRVVAGDGVDEGVVAGVRDAVAAHAVPDDPANSGAVVDHVTHVLTERAGNVRVTGGTSFVLTQVSHLETPHGVRIVRSTDATIPSLPCPPNWHDDEWAQLVAGQFGPWVMALDGAGTVTSYCHTPGGVTDAAAEAGVWTHPDHRGRRLAQLVTAAWAAMLRAPGRVLFYSADRDNDASQRVAERLGARHIARDWYFDVGPWAEGDAWGRALADHHSGRYVPRIELETGDGRVGLAMRPDWFFRTYDEWDWWDRELLPLVTAGPVLDLGAGAGRAALWFQDRGFDVTAVDNSPRAVRVCRDRGVADVRVADLNDPPGDRLWGAVLLLCGNLGLGGSYSGVRALLTRLAELCAPGAILIGDTVEPRNAPKCRLRIRYRDVATPWWGQYNIPVAEIATIVEDTGWTLDKHLVDGLDHAVLLRRNARSHDGTFGPRSS